MFYWICYLFYHTEDKYTIGTFTEIYRFVINGYVYSEVQMLALLTPKLIKNIDLLEKYNALFTILGCQPVYDCFNWYVLENTE